MLSGGFNMKNYLGAILSQGDIRCYVGGTNKIYYSILYKVQDKPQHEYAMIYIKNNSSDQYVTKDDSYPYFYKEEASKIETPAPNSKGIVTNIFVY